MSRHNPRFCYGYLGQPGRQVTYLARGIDWPGHQLYGMPNAGQPMGVPAPSAGLAVWPGHRLFGSAIACLGSQSPGRGAGANPAPLCCSGAGDPPLCAGTIRPLVQDDILPPPPLLSLARENDVLEVVKFCLCSGLRGVRLSQAVHLGSRSKILVRMMVPGVGGRLSISCAITR